MQSTLTSASVTALRSRTVDDLQRSQSQVAKLAPRLDMRQLILSRMQYRPRSVDDRVIDAWAELTETVRQRTGFVPNGTWVPLSALSRDLTVGNSAAMLTGALATEAAPGILPDSAVFEAGATVLSGLSGSTFSLPVIEPSFSTNGLWVTEGNPAQVREPSFAQAQLTPKTLTVQMNVTRRLLTNANVDVDAMLRREIAAQLAHAIDSAAINGAGSTDPLGLLGQAGLEVVSAGADGAAPTWDHVVELEARVRARAGGNGGALGYLLGPALAKKMRKTPRVAGTATMLFEGRDLLGYGARISPNVPENLTKGTSAWNCAALIFGDMSEVYVGFWGPAAVDLIVDDYTQRDSGLVRLVARAEVGVAVRRIKAFACYKDLLPA